jgi:hypothetical protein
MPNSGSKYGKIASAVYLITGFFTDSEPLKWKLRTLAADLVSEREKDKLTIDREIRSLFHLAKNANLVSETNHDILVQELSKLTSNLEKPLDKLFLSEATTVENSLVQKTESPVLKDKIISSPEPRKHSEYLSLEIVDKEKPLKQFGAVSVKKNSRQNVIISLLKRKKEIMIKDVSPLISGCSEKTIQRELSAMVATGILKKMGEKRWSRYSLASLAQNS